MTMHYGRANNVKLGTWVPGRCEYAFVDVPEHRADALFIRAEVPVKFRRNEMGNDDVEFVIVFCHFKKIHEERFLECMADLERAMFLEGYAGYGEFCDLFLGPFVRESST